VELTSIWEPVLTYSLPFEECTYIKQIQSKLESGY